MRLKFRMLCGLLLTLAWNVASPSTAAGLEDDIWLWAGSDDFFSMDEDALFGSGGVLTEIEPALGSSLEEAFLVREGIDVGGRYSASAEAAWAWTPEEGRPAAGEAERRADLAGSLFLDARPSRNLRAFAKIRGEVRLTETPLDPNVALHELFVDFDLSETAFFRLGKQTVEWGVGYFFSPADIINVGRIDPENPETEREGPVALRLHVPSGRDNFYAYAVVDGKPGAYRVALAPKVEFVVGRSEVGAGLYYRADRAPRAMATLSTSLGRFSLFGEAVLSKGSDKRFVEEVPASPDNPFGLAVVTDQNTLRFHGTVGVRATHSDPDGRFSVSAAGQYYYNGEGYDGEFTRANRAAMLDLVSLGELSATDLTSMGRHYAALSLSGTSRLLRDLTPAAFWLGNLSDGSGMLSLSLSYTRWESVRPSINVSRTYGNTGSEFAPLSPETRFTVSITVARSW